MEQDILSKLLSTLNRVTTCSLCEKSEDLNILSCGHLYCKTCIEKSRKPHPSVYVICELCNRSMVYKNNDRRNKFLDSLDQFKAEISKKMSANFICKELIVMFDNQEACSPDFAVPIALAKGMDETNVSNTEKTDCNEMNSHGNKSLLSSHDKQHTLNEVDERHKLNEIDNPFPGWDTVKENELNNADLCTDLKGIRNVNNSDCSNGSDKKLTAVTDTKDITRGRKRCAPIFNKDEQKKCKFNAADNCTPDRFTHEKFETITNILKTTERRKETDVLSKNISKVEGKTATVSNNKLETSNMENRPDKVEEKNNLSFEPKNKRNSVLSKRFSSKIPNNRTMTDLRRNFNVPSPVPLLIQKTKNKPIKIDSCLKKEICNEEKSDNKEDDQNSYLTDDSSSKTKPNVEKSDKQDDKNDVFVDESLKNKRCTEREFVDKDNNRSDENKKIIFELDRVKDCRELDCAKENGFINSRLNTDVKKSEKSEKVFQTQIPENIPIQMDTKSSTENCKPSLEVAVCETTYKENIYSSVACQTTSDLHKELLFKEFPELLANFSAIISEDSKRFSGVCVTPVERKDDNMKTPIDSGNGKSIIVSSVTSSERKNFDEKEFLSNSVIRTNDYGISGKKVKNDQMEKTLCQYNNKAVSRKRSLKFDDDDITNTMTDEYDSDKELTGINLLDEDTDVSMVPLCSDQSECDDDDDDDGIQNTTDDRLVTPKRLRTAQDIADDDDEPIASTPTMLDRVLSSDGTMDKLINRSNPTKLDSIHSSFEIKEKSFDVHISTDNETTATKHPDGDSRSVVEIAAAIGKNASQGNSQPSITVQKRLHDSVVSVKEPGIIPFAIHQTPLMGNRICLVTSGLNETEISLIKVLAEKMSFKWSNTLASDATHLVVKIDENNRVPRTLKYFQALSRHIPIVSSKWIETCYRRNRLVKEEHFMPLDFSGECGPFRSYLAYRGLGNSLDWLRSYCIHFIKPYPDNCPLRELEEITINMGSIWIKYVEEFRKYPKHHKIVIFADGTCSNATQRQQINEWLESYNAVTIQFSWFIEVIGRYRAVSFFNYQMIPSTVSTLMEKNFPIDMLENENFSDNEV